MRRWLFNRQYNRVLSMRNSVAKDYFENIMLLKDMSHEIDSKVVEYSNALKDLLLVQNEFLEHKKHIHNTVNQDNSQLLAFYQLAHEYDDFVQKLESTMEELEGMELKFADTESNFIAKENIDKAVSILDLNHMLIKKLNTELEKTFPSVDGRIDSEHLVRYNKKHAFPN